MFPGSVWANIAPGNHLCNVDPYLKDSFYEKKNPYNVVSTMLGQHCIGILSSQCCPSTSKIDSVAQENYLCNFSLEHKYILSQKNRLFDDEDDDELFLWYG